MLVAALARMPRSFMFTHTTGATTEISRAHALLSSPNAELCHAGALAGMRIAALPSFAVQTELEQGRLERVLGDWRLFDVTAATPGWRTKPRLHLGCGSRRECTRLCRCKVHSAARPSAHPAKTLFRPLSPQWLLQGTVRINRQRNA
jgi:DNA-binding transcriptional LysR family regulator